MSDLVTKSDSKPNGLRDVIIIGSGPSGYAAGIYLSRASLDPLLFAGEKAGGQLMLTTDVENYPGFPEGMMGPELMVKMREQAEKFGTEMVDKNITRVDFSQKPFRVWSEAEEFQAKAVVLATGAEAMLVGVPGEKELMGRGVSTCAVCDAAFYKDKVTYVVGGGDAAMEEAMALIKFAKSVTMIHRRDAFKASKIMQDRVLIDNKHKVNVLWHSELKEVRGDGRVQSIAVLNSQTQQTQELSADGVFIAIGHRPVTEFLGGQVDIDEKGYVITRLVLNAKSLKLAQSFLDENGLLQYPTMTSVEGVFAAGDVVDFRYRQAVTAAGYGTMAALDAQWWLERE